MSQFTDYHTPLACGCSLAEGRCPKHAAMMREIHAAWHGAWNAMGEHEWDAPTVATIIWSLSDGYGEQGYVPEQGYDWSGIRDSSTDAIEAMHKALHA